MESIIRQLLSSKGLNVPDEDYELTARQWEALQPLKRDFEESFVGETDIALKYVPGGDHA